MADGWLRTAYFTIVRSMPIRALKLSVIRLFLALLSGILTGNASATDPADPAWRQFQHAMGDTPAIGANAGHPLADAVTRPVPVVTLQDIDVHKFLLGNDLFHERRLSADNTTGCITCHAGPGSGTDGRPVSFGVDRARGRFNALTTFNAHFNFRQFWDGRSVTLADQALEPIISELEMANTLENALATLQADASYVDSFNSIYPDGLSINNMADAMSHFQTMHFNVSDSPFQRFLNNSPEALSGQALRGWQTFRDIGCSSCHNGINLGGNSYQRLGVLRAYYPEQRDAVADDAGLAARTMRAEDLHVVRVPNLHNIAMTMPYFHDGSISTLNVAIEQMARYQLGRELGDQDIADIAEFLKSLTGRPAGFALGSEIGRLGRSTEPVADFKEESHSDAYQAAIMAITPTHQQLLADMQRVGNGDVAHFDFVQFQHLQLIRHARALQFPPADLPNTSQSCLRDEAKQLLDQVMALEWPIANYLQAQAMLGILRAHLNTPADSSPDAGETNNMLADHHAAAEKNLADVSASTVSAAALRLGNCPF